MANEFAPSDVGRLLACGGGLARITAYTDGETVTAEVLSPFPASAMDSGDWVLLGSPQTMCTPSVEGPVGAKITLTLSLGGWRATDVGAYVRINGGLCRIVEVQSATVADAYVEAELSAAVGAPANSWSIEYGVWTEDNGYPRCGALFGQRLWAGGSKAYPQTVWGSVIGEYLDFTLGTLDDEGIAFIVDGAGEYNPILHLATVRGLIALTTGAEFNIVGSADNPITPTNVRVYDQSAHGSANVGPVRIGNELYFLQRAGRKIRAMSANQYDSEQYNSPDMSVLAEHITEPRVVKLAYQQEPDSLLWAVRADGQVAVLTADRDQEVFGWSRQVTQGAIESIETIPTPDGFAVFAVVARVVDGVLDRYIEMFDPDLHTDSAVTGVSESGATTWAGLDHLEGRIVRVKGDGIVLESRTVSGGQVTIERPAKHVEIGLDYITTVKTLTPEAQVPINSLQGARLRAHEVKVRLRDTIGASVNLQEVAFRNFGSEVLDQAPVPFTGDKVAGNLGWGDGTLQTLIQQTQPYPFHLLAVITKLTANEG